MMRGEKKERKEKHLLEPFDKMPRRHYSLLSVINALSASTKAIFAVDKDENESNAFASVMDAWTHKVLTLKFMTFCATSRNSL